MPRRLVDGVTRKWQLEGQRLPGCGARTLVTQHQAPPAAQIAAEAEAFVERAASEDVGAAKGKAAGLDDIDRSGSGGLVVAEVGCVRAVRADDADTGVAQCLDQRRHDVAGRFDVRVEQEHDLAGRRRRPQARAVAMPSRWLVQTSSGAAPPMGARRSPPASAADSASAWLGRRRIGHDDHLAARR